MAKIKKNATICKKDELARVRAGKVFIWYRDKKREVLENNLDAVPYEYRGALDYMKLQIRFQLENAKMQPTDKIAFLIFSIPAVLTCPGATGLCMHYCYARRDERFTKTRASRLSNWLLTLRVDFVDILSKAINDAIYDKRGKIRAAFAGKQIIVRVHESGDFYNLDYMRKWFEVARNFISFKNIHFFAYTKSFDILDKCIDEKPENFIIRASIWDDTTANDLYIIEKHNLPFYKALSALTGYKKANICNCATGCGGCGCKCSKDIREVVTKIH